MNVGVMFFFPENVKSYNVCMGKVENYFFNINNFYEEAPTGPLTNVPWTNPYRFKLFWENFWEIKILKYLTFCRWLLGILYNSFIIIVPYCYVKIYYFRKNLKTPGTRTGSVDKDMEKRKKRNIVTFSYNMLVWIIEALFAVIVSRVYILFLFDYYPQWAGVGY